MSFWKAAQKIDVQQFTKQCQSKRLHSFYFIVIVYFTNSFIHFYIYSRHFQMFLQCNSTLVWY